MSDVECVIFDLRADETVYNRKTVRQLPGESYRDLTFQSCT